MIWIIWVIGMIAVASMIGHDVINIKNPFMIVFAVLFWYIYLPFWIIKLAKSEN